MPTLVLYGGFGAYSALIIASALAYAVDPDRFGGKRIILYFSLAATMLVATVFVYTTVR